ncbi:MAG TPA: site-specific integrase [Edaphobacter sp.]|nr:site-specific integrase [Edaphobacter sp.]
MPRKEEDTWVLRFRVSSADGKRVENTLPVGLVRDFPNEASAWREVDRLGLAIRVNCDAPCSRPHPVQHTCRALSESRLRRRRSTAEGGENRQQRRTYRSPLSHRPICDALADDIKPLDIQRWVKWLHADQGLVWTTVSKIRGVMLRIYKVGLLHELCTRNPAQPVETRSKTSYRAIVLTPQQTLAIIRALPNVLHRILVLTCAATALRSSELLALRWADIEWTEARIRISKRWAQGKDGRTKTESSDGYVPLHSALARHLIDWRSQTPYAKETDFVFPSLRANGKVPLSPAIFVADHLRTAAIGIGIPIEKGQRFGLHNLRHSLSNWLINKAKTEPKTVQGILRHSRIQTTMDLYTQEDRDETRATQGQFLEALAMPLLQWLWAGLWVGFIAQKVCK